MTTHHDSVSRADRKEYIAGFQKLIFRRLTSLATQCPRGYRFGDDDLGELLVNELVLEDGVAFNVIFVEFEHSLTLFVPSDHPVWEGARIYPELSMVRFVAGQETRMTLNMPTPAQWSAIALKLDDLQTQVDIYLDAEIEQIQAGIIALASAGEIILDEED